MILGTLCVLCSLRKGKDYMYKPAGMFFAFAGKVEHLITASLALPETKL